MKRFYFFGLIQLFFSPFLFGQQFKVDSSFGNQGIMLLNSTDSLCVTYPAFDIQEKIRVTHNTYVPSSPGNYYPGVMQFHSNGSSIDSSFSQDGILNYSYGAFNNNAANNNVVIELITLQDGRTLAGGRKKSLTLPYIYHNAVTCIKPNGTIDSSFGNQGIQIVNHNNNDSRVNHLHQQKSSRIIAYTNCFSTERNYMFALTTTGKRDSSYGVNGICDWFGLKIPGELVYHYPPLMDTNDNTFILRRVHDSSTFAIKRNEWLKIKSNGFVDSTFGINGFKTIDPASLSNTLQMSPGDQKFHSIDLSGNLYVMGTIMNNNIQTVVKFKPNGNIDSSFGVQGICSLPVLPVDTNYNAQIFRTCVPYADGSLFLAGEASDTLSNFESDGAIAHVTAQGIIDTNFFKKGFYYLDANFNKADGYRKIITHSNGDLFFCGTADFIGNNYNDYYLIHKFKGGSPLSVADQSINPVLLCYPNPAQHQLQIQSNTPIAYISLYNVMGASVYKTQIPSLHQVNINLPPLHSGLYMVEVGFPQGVKDVQKVWIQQ